MSKNSLAVRHLLTLPVEPADVIELELEYLGGTGIRGRLTGNGQTNHMFVAQSPDKNAVDYFMSLSPEAMASKFDPTGMVANKLDGLKLVDNLKDHLSKMENVSDEERQNLNGQIDRMAIVTNLMALHAVGFQLMVSLYGYNWVAEQSAQLIRKSSDWLALVDRVGKAQEGLKAALSS